MPFWTDEDVFLTNPFKEFVSVNDVPESYPNPNSHPKTKFLQDIRNQFDKNIKTLHTTIRRRPGSQTKFNSRANPPKYP